jgi:hypothetical protein
MFRSSLIRASRRIFVIPEATQTTPGKRPDNMDGDNTAKTMDQGANSAMKNSEMSTRIRESSHHAVDPRCELELSIFLLCHMTYRIQLARRQQARIHRSSIKMGLLESNSRPIEPLAA